MTAFVLPSIVTVQGTRCHAPHANIKATSYLPRLLHRPKRRRAPVSFSRMESSDKTSKLSSENNSSDEDEDDDDERLQKDPVYVYREFGKVSAVAVLIGLVLFFYDILISLWVTTIGLVYALAVLFEVKGADTLFSNVLKTSRKLWSSFTDGARKGWKALRREVWKGLKD